MGGLTIEGLSDGRFAIYMKMHHALIDGVSAMRLLQRTLTDDPFDSRLNVPWGTPPVLRDDSARPESPWTQMRAAVPRLLRGAGSIAAPLRAPSTGGSPCP